MNAQWMDRRIAWLAAGTLLGMAVSTYFPAEPAYASTAVASEKFAMATANTLAGNSEAIFVLDKVTGRLFGAAYNTQTGTFTHRYARNLALDFQVADRAEYVMVSGMANLRSTGGGPPASGVLYIGELNSGIVIMYAYPYIQSPRDQMFELQQVGQFPWRQASN